MDLDDKGFGTRAVHGGGPSDPVTGAVVPPISLATTFEQEAVGTINRSDGTIQLTLGGWPVYRFSGDPQPGATSGQGNGGGEWAAVTPEGQKAATLS